MKTPTEPNYEALGNDERRFLERAAHAAMRTAAPAWFLPLMPPQPQHPVLPELKAEAEAKFYERAVELCCGKGQVGMQGERGHMQHQQRIVTQEWTPENILHHPEFEGLSRVPDLGVAVVAHVRALLGYQQDCNEWQRMEAEETIVQWPMYFAWRQLHELKTRKLSDWGPTEAPGA